MSLPRLPSNKGGGKHFSRKEAGSNQVKRPSLPTLVDLIDLTELDVDDTYKRTQDYSDESVVEKDNVSVESDKLDVNYDDNNEESISNPEVNPPGYSEMDHESESTDDSYEAYLKQIAEDEGEVNHPSDLNEEIEGEDESNS